METASIYCTEPPRFATDVCRATIAYNTRAAAWWFVIIMRRPLYCRLSVRLSVTLSTCYVHPRDSKREESRKIKFGRTLNWRGHAEGKELILPDLVSAPPSRWTFQQNEKFIKIKRYCDILQTRGFYDAHIMYHVSNQISKSGLRTLTAWRVLSPQQGCAPHPSLKICHKTPLMPLVDWDSQPLSLFPA